MLGEAAGRLAGSCISFMTVGGILSSFSSAFSFMVVVGNMPHLPSLELRGGIGGCFAASEPLMPSLGIKDELGLPWATGVDTRRCWMS